jgi:hypothetical protein
LGRNGKVGRPALLGQRLFERGHDGKTEQKVENGPHFTES